MQEMSQSSKYTLRFRVACWGFSRTRRRFSHIRSQAGAQFITVLEGRLRRCRERSEPTQESSARVASILNSQISFFISASVYPAHVSRRRIRMNRASVFSISAVVSFLQNNSASWEHLSVFSEPCLSKSSVKYMTSFPMRCLLM